MVFQVVGAHRTFVVLEDQTKNGRKGQQPGYFSDCVVTGKARLGHWKWFGWAFLTVPCRNQGFCRIPLFPYTRLFSEIPRAVLRAFPLARCVARGVHVLPCWDEKGAEPQLVEPGAEELCPGTAHPLLCSSVTQAQPHQGTWWEGGKVRRQSPAAAASQHGVRSRTLLGPGV